MNKHEEARKVLNKFRNAYYNAIFYEKEKEVANALNEVLPYLEATEKAYEELKQKVNFFKIEFDDLYLKHHLINLVPGTLIFKLHEAMTKLVSDLK